MGAKQRLQAHHERTDCVYGVATVLFQQQRHDGHATSRRSISDEGNFETVTQAPSQLEDLLVPSESDRRVLQRHIRFVHHTCVHGTTALAPHRAGPWL